MATSCEEFRRPKCGDPKCKGCKNRVKSSGRDRINPEEYDEATKELVNCSRLIMKGTLTYPEWADSYDHFNQEIEKLWHKDLPEFPSPDKLSKEAQAYSKSIFTNYYTLKKILNRHESTIQKRWMKKSRQQRLQILLKAWPDMPPAHRPDYKAFDSEHQDTRSSKYGSKFKDWYMWPYINQEDLSQPKLLLLFLNSRGRNLPPTFAATDCDAMHVGRVTEGLNPSWLNGYTMMMTGTEKASQYGYPLPWKDDEVIDLIKLSIFEGYQFFPGEGLLVLKAQARVMEFLVDCSRQILHEIPPDKIISAAYPIQPKPILKTGIDESGHLSMAAMALEAPYTVPSELDFDRIASLLEAQTSAMEDHIWAMREDPAYFSQVLLEKKDHSMEDMLDTNGKPHPLAHKLHEHKLWATLLTRICAEDYSKLEIMHILQAKARHVSRLAKKYRDQFNPGTQLPEPFRDALYSFRYFLRMATKEPLETLKVEYEASPPLRFRYVREPPGTSCCGGDTCKIIPAQIIIPAQQNLFFLMDMIHEDAEKWARQSILVDELERLLRSEPEADRLISNFVMGKIGYLSILSHCIKQLELFQPWARQYSYQKLFGYEGTHDFEDRYEAATAERDLRVRVLTGGGLPLDDLGRLADPSGGKFAYPYGKRRNKDTVNTLRQAEANLDAVWAELDSLMKRNMPWFEDLALYELLSQPQSLRRTPEWAEPDQTKKEKKQPGTENDLWSLNRPLSNLFLGESEQPGQKIETVPLKKTKAKTKGEPTKIQIVEVPAAEVPETEQVDHQPTFEVDARALKVFRMLFFNPEVTSSPGTVPWNDFLHAMASAGFQMEKLYGSVWQFQPTGLDVERGIHFHEPHPKGKIVFEIARRHGRRLARTYGWHGGMFVLKGK